jgi:hypothetical protein
MNEIKRKKFWTRAAELRISSDGEFILWCHANGYKHEHVANIMAHITKLRTDATQENHRFISQWDDDAVSSFCEALYTSHHRSEKHHP